MTHGKTPHLATYMCVTAAPEAPAVITSVPHNFVGPTLMAPLRAKRLLMGKDINPRIHVGSCKQTLYTCRHQYKLTGTKQILA